MQTWQLRWKSEVVRTLENELAVQEIKQDMTIWKRSNETQML